MLKIVSNGLIVLCFILAAALDVFACSCANPPSVEQSFEQSAAVFYGTVEEVSGGDNKSIQALFKVEKSWKGADSAEALVITDATSCGIDFKAGETYYLFVDRDGNAANTFRTVPCRRHAGRQEEFLKDKPLIRLKPGHRPSNLLFYSVAVTGFIITLAAVLVIGLYYFKSRKSDGLKKE